MSKSTIELKKKYTEFKREMIREMESIGIDHFFPYMLEQYFEDATYPISIDKKSDKLCAISKEIRRIFFSGNKSDNFTAVAALMDDLPTPPFPPKTIIFSIILNTD